MFICVIRGQTDGSIHLCAHLIASSSTSKISTAFAGIFPLARGRFSVEEGRLRSFELRDDAWALDYDLPPLRVLHLSLAGSEVAGRINPNHAMRGALSLRYEGREHELEGAPDEQLETLHRRLAE